jgi:3-oxocholest-4-en-26-oyl-CoA dehydrogenase beta subunit
VRDAGAADAIICLARSGEGAEDLTLALVPRATPGVRLRKLTTAGGASLWEVVFDGVTVTADAIVGERGAGWQAASRTLLRGAAFKSAELVGIGNAALRLTLDYARTRIQFGVPIGSFQAVQHHCAGMYRELEVCRLLVWQAADSLARGGVREVALAKAKTSEAIPKLTRLAHQVHGAIGYYRDYPLELYYHRAIDGQAAYGDAAHHRRVLAQFLPDSLERFRGLQSA